MMYAPEYEEDRPAIIDVGYDLPPMRLTIPVDEYIVDVAEDRTGITTSSCPNPRSSRSNASTPSMRCVTPPACADKVRRIDLDTITFATGSAEVSMSQAKTMRNVAEAMNKILEKDPGETFSSRVTRMPLAPTSPTSSFPTSVPSPSPVLLTEVYGIPAENLVTQGYGERFLKIARTGRSRRTAASPFAA